MHATLPLQADRLAGLGEALLGRPLGPAASHAHHFHHNHTTASSQAY